MYHVLLYYKIVKVKAYEQAAKTHKEVCKALGLKGRIIIGADGINGTVAGRKQQLDQYVAYMNQHKVFEKIDFKWSTAESVPFPRLSVKARKELIVTSERDEFQLGARGNHVDRDTFHQWLKNEEDMVILDMRNDYEWEIGRFKGAVKPKMKYFRELKDTMDMYEQYKDKKVVMFCTGGIRCEPASAQFLARGFDKDKIFQLEGGIVKYAEKYGDEGYYEGKCFVFDDRIAVPIDTTENAKVLGGCKHCQTTTDSYRNCANRCCNDLFLACDNCNTMLQNTCSAECNEIIADPANLRPPRHKVAVKHRNK